MQTMDIPNPTLTTGWFALASSRSLCERPLGTTLFGRPLVLARTASGELLALDDCCPHRHVPLSEGRMTDQGIQCPYHGWTFDAGGRCTVIPGLAAGACMPNVRVGGVQAIEQDGLVWARLASGTDAATPALPDYLRRLSPSTRRFIWETEWKASPVDALENFLDPLHTHFVHSGLVRRQGTRRAAHAHVTRAQGVLRVDYAGQSAQNGWLYRLFESPRTAESAHFAVAAPGSAQLEYRYRNGSALYFTLHFSPIDARRTRVLGTLHVENRWAPAWMVRLLAWPLLRRVARQDQKIVEMQAANRARCRRHEGVSTPLDLVRPSLDEAWAPGAAPARRAAREHIVQMML